MLVWRIVVGLVLCLMGRAIEEGRAAETMPIATSHTYATLVSDHDALGSDHALRLALHLQLKPGWHTYWVNPGDAGDSPTMSVQISGALQGQGGDFSWPVPERISEGGLMTYAYTGDVLLPQNISLKEAGYRDTKDTSVHVKAHAEWLVCKDVCVPEEGDFTLDLPLINENVPESKEASLFHHAEAHMPQPSPFRALLLPEGVLVLTGSGLSSRTVRQVWFLPLENGLLKQTASQALSVLEGQIRLKLTPDPALKFPYWQKPLEGVVVMVDGAGNRSALRVTAQPVSGLSSVSLNPGPVSGIVSGAWHIHAHAVTWDSAWRFLFSAFLGGLILNLMPCVFPVLVIKVLSLVRVSGNGRQERMTSAFFYTLGVMGSLLVLGGIMIALRLAGSAVGWGFQFQSPGFVVSVCWLFLLMALNLLGVFQITGRNLTGSLGQMANTGGYYRDMITGFLAVIVATPCTAPFMGVAIAGALSGPIALGLLVFLAMGLGLAFPYLLIAGAPGLVVCLPRPGVWMEVLKQLLAFPLLATCVWLLWLVGVQRGVDFVALTAGGAVLLGLAAWLYGLAQKRAMRDGGVWVIRLCRGLAMLCVVVSVGTLFRVLAVPFPVLSQAMQEHTQTKDMPEPFSEQRLAVLRAEGRPVFVDITASWCITCMVNERVALNVSSVQVVFRKQDVVILRGDWTNRDETISAYLKAQGRDGVPLYIYYPPYGEAKQLPQILTPAIVLDSLKY